MRTKTSLILQLKLMIGGGVSLFIVIFTIVIIVDSVHTINEGMVGIYFIHGALHERVRKLDDVTL